MSDYSAADNYYAMINTMAELFTKSSSLRVDAYYLSFDRYKSHKVAALLNKADELDTQAYEYMYLVDSIHR